MGDWQQVQFQALLAEPVRNGIYKPKEFHGRGSKIVNMGELFAYPRLNAIDMKRVELSSSELERFALQKGDLLFARRSLTADGAGKCSIVMDVEGETTFESSIIRARPSPEKADSLFLYYFFISPSGFNLLDTIRRQVAVAGITGSDLSALKIPVPPLAEQCRIASVLGALDDKIDLNRRMNQTLKDMAQAIFKDWFIDFGPIRAKMDGREPQGLSSEIAALFPSRLDDEGKPEGWARVPVASFGTLMRETTSPAATPRELFEHYSLPAFDSGHEPTVELGASIMSNKTRMPRNCILLSKLNPSISRVWLVDPSRTIKAVCSTEFLAFMPIGNYGREFLYSLFLQEDFRRNLEAFVTGTSSSHQRVSPQAVVDTQVVAPSATILNSFGNLVAPWLDRILANRRESKILVELRDLLLPGLISGEVRIESAENLVGAT